MRKKLTAEDIRKLKYACRPGIIFPVIILLIGLLILLDIVFILNIELTRVEMALVILTLFLISLFVGYGITYKLIRDIRNGEKSGELKKISKKHSYISYEAGSGSLYIGQKQKAHDIYNLIIDNVKYRVEREFYEASDEGDEVILFYAPISRFRLSIELKKVP
jgi:hypothetical protein